MIYTELAVLTNDSSLQLQRRNRPRPHLLQHFERAGRQESELKHSDAAAFGQPVGLQHALGFGSEVNEPVQAKIGQLLQIRLRQVGETVRAKQAPPACTPATSGWIASEIAKVNCAFEVEAPSVGFGHSRAITRPAGSRILYSI